MLLAGAVFGAGAFPLYPLAVAHANDNARPDQFVEVSSGLLLVFGIGAAIGPLLASLVRQVMGMPMLFVFTGAVHTVLIAFILWRMSLRAAPPPEDRTRFQRRRHRRLDRRLLRSGCPHAELPAR